jgi:hypothetical protein
MARVRSTARVTHDGEETEAAETAPIFELMRRSGLVVTEGASDEDAPATEAEQADIEEGDAGEEEIDYNTTMPSKLITPLCHRSSAIWILGSRLCLKLIWP